MLFSTLTTIFLFCVTLPLIHPTITAASTTLGNKTDFVTLLQIKKSISSDPYGILVSWNTSNHFCSWGGVTCGIKHQRVVMLNLKEYHLSGTISPYIGNLSFLRILNLLSNKFYGEIPRELGRLFRLRKLNLSNNNLTGEFPISLTNCSKLRYLNFSANSFHGKIPIEVGSLKKLEKLSLFKNNFGGKIPPSIGNISSLNVFSIAVNNLEGKLPGEFGQLKKLSMLVILSNRFSGMLPSSFCNMTSLAFFSAAENQFHGSLPAGMFSALSNLQMFEIGMNQISGPIPTSIANASLLQKFDIGFNNFVGQVPSVEKLQHLTWLNLNYNNLGSGSDGDLDFITSLVNCTKLENLVLGSNKLGGILPISIGNLSTQLIEISLFVNHIHGTIPETIGNNINLISLYLGDNHFSGNVPNSFGKFHKMQSLDVGQNHLLGEIPPYLGNLTQLVEISIANNMLEGKIPPIIANWQKLQILDFSRNNFAGEIPQQIFGLPSLSIFLNLSHNSFNGNLSVEVGSLSSLDTLDISHNYLSGEIPETIGECKSMEYLDLHGNSFNGVIPSSIASLKGLTHLDLSLNNLFGTIPIELQSLSFLTYLNLSFNNLEGKVPIEGVFKNASAISVAGDHNHLCGGISELNLAACPATIVLRNKHHNLKQVVIIVCVIRGFPLTTKLDLEALVLSTRDFVAIKVMNIETNEANKSFIAECNALKFMRRRNLAKILTCCSSIDFKGNDFKALVFEYMANGSLEKWLQPCGESIEDESHPLDLAQRLNILIDVANALHYLHYECVEPIIHCDLKPSNVLLDDHMVGHVTDFGLARLLTDSNQQSTTIGLKFKYGIGSPVSMQGDTYSFGILALEMLSGKRPTEEMFKDGENLHHYVSMAYSNNLLEIVDSTLFTNQIQRRSTEEESIIENVIIILPKEETCVFSLTRIALACSMESPNDRMNIKDVIRELNLSRSAFLHG
ncbi:LRR receptor-like serine/threonine-protein kinase EFR [Arachis hypogaea]|uniref:LRR receptor-like serine/threonine-protein kinase EFR n=1 Tax=Arachis hypogaea TaxID=3818 RepID=UPI003B21A519